MLRIQLLLTAHLATTLGPPSSLAWIIAVASRRAPFSDLGPSQSTCSPAAGKMPCSMMSGHAVPQAGTLKWIFLLTRETKVSTVCRAFCDRAPCLSLCSRSVAVLFTLPPCCPVATLTQDTFSPCFRTSHALLPLRLSAPQPPDSLYLISHCSDITFSARSSLTTIFRIVPHYCHSFLHFKNSISLSNVVENLLFCYLSVKYYKLRKGWDSFSLVKLHISIHNILVPQWCSNIVEYAMLSKQSLLPSKES